MTLRDQRSKASLRASVDTARRFHMHLKRHVLRQVIPVANFFRAGELLVEVRQQSSEECHSNARDVTSIYDFSAHIPEFENVGLDNTWHGWTTLQALFQGVGGRPGKAQRNNRDSPSQGTRATNSMI